MDRKAETTQNAILDIVHESPGKIITEIPKMVLPKYCGIKSKDVDLKRLGSILWLAQESQTTHFEDLLLLKGLGPRTLQSLALVSEVIHGTPSRFSDPARFSFAHGGKSGTPFPVPTKIYDETIHTLKNAVNRAKIGLTDKQKAIAKLSQLAQRAEKGFKPNANFDKLLEKEKKNAWKFGGRTIDGFSKPNEDRQLSLFE